MVFIIKKTAIETRSASFAGHLLYCIMLLPLRTYIWFVWSFCSLLQMQLKHYYYALGRIVREEKLGNRLSSESHTIDSTLCTKYTVNELVPIIFSKFKRIFSSARNWSIIIIDYFSINISAIKLKSLEDWQKNLIHFIKA